MASKVGYAFQNPNDQLFARTVVAEVRFGPRNLGYSADRQARLVDWALAMTRLTDVAEVHPYELSLTERKRVALASVLAMDMPVVVLDEPTTGQDFAGVRGVGAIVGELASRGRTVVVISHDMDFCAENADRIVVMSQGQVVRAGAPAEVFAAAGDLALAPVQPPQIMRLAEALGWQERMTTVDAFVDRLADSREH